MSLTTNHKAWKILFIIFLLLTVMFTLFFYFSSIFITFIIGILFLMITIKMISYYREKMDKYSFSRIKRKVQGYTLLIFWIFIAYFLVGTSIAQFSEVVSSVNEQNQTILGTYIERSEEFFPDKITEIAFNDNAIRKIEEYAFSFFKILFSQVSFLTFNGVLMIPLMYYMYFRRRKIIIKKIMSYIPKEMQGSVKRAANKIGVQLNEFFTAKLTESVVIGSICCLGFYVAGLKGWLILGILAGFLNIIPFIGPVLGAIPPILIALLDEPIVAVYVLSTVIIAQAVDNFYLIPFMLTGKVKIDALLGVVLILSGAKVLGVLGMIFAIPIFLVYKIILSESHKELKKIYK